MNVWRGKGEGKLMSVLLVWGDVVTTGGGRLTLRVFSWRGSTKAGYIPPGQYVE